MEIVPMFIVFALGFGIGYLVKEHFGTRIETPTELAQTHPAPLTAEDVRAEVAGAVAKIAVGLILAAAVFILGGLPGLIIFAVIVGPLALLRTLSNSRKNV